MIRSTKGVATLKRKESKVVKAQLPKKRKGPTGDSIFISDTSGNESDRPSTVNNGTIQTDSEGDNEERGDIELGMSAFNSYEKEKKKRLRMILRTFEKRVERTNLHLLLPRTRHWLSQRSSLP